MKKRIGSKLYDTDKGIPVIPEMGLYKQPKNKTFYFFDGEKISPIDYEEAERIISEMGDQELYEKSFGYRADTRGMGRIAVSVDHLTKLAAYARKTGKSQKRIIEEFIDSLSIDE